MRLVVISGRSGSGKSSALHVLEDLGFYCIDNLPIGLLPALASQADANEKLTRVAVSIDARNLSATEESIEKLLIDLPNDHYQLDVVYLDASENVLLQRFSATRRKHPLTTDQLSLAEAIDQEKVLLDPLANMADLTLDTTHMSVHELRSMIRLRVADRPNGEMSILFESFGFKHGIPTDADYVFDVRHLPNPYWNENLRAFTGLDSEVQLFLNSHDVVAEMRKSISDFLSQWTDRLIAANRSYMTIAIGCTGGQHRSVYLAEQLATEYRMKYPNVQVRHRELARTANLPSH
ncbi:RNase adapter RapZ [Thalassolituus sp.]|uniref:RNase adapter RapZ n=1 Tax=Thalassolituus sp. TaxID=2030822 RepID=UPI0035174E40